MILLKPDTSNSKIDNRISRIAQLIMNFVRAVFRGFAATALVLFILLIVAANSPTIAIYLAMFVAAVALASFKWPIRILWVESGMTSYAILLVAIAAVFVSLRVGQQQRAALEEERIARIEARSALLREEDPKAYLEELKSASDPRWELEFQKLDESGYDLFVAERRAKAEQARRASIDKLQQQLKTVSIDDLERLEQIYLQLAGHDPGNVVYQKELASLGERLRKKRVARALADDQRRYPENFVTIEKFSWSIDGFGTVMIANFTIRNSLPWPVKDIQIRCIHSAPSGTDIDQNTRTLYERIEANSTKRIVKFNMGFIHTQAKRSGCSVTRVVSLG